MALEGQWVHVPHSQCEQHVAASVPADEVGGYGGVCAGDAAGVIVHGNEVGGQTAGGFKEVEGGAAGRGEIADNQGSASLGVVCFSYLRHGGASTKW